MQPKSSRSIHLLAAAHAVLFVACGGGGSPATPDAAPRPDSIPGCILPECGISCNDPDVCGTCGDGVCDEGESHDSCPFDCCDPDACDPAAGDPYAAGDARCAAAPDGTRCDDADPANGAETCRAGRCLREARDCRCMPAGGVYPDPLPPTDVDLPALPTDPPWVGALPAEPSFADDWALRRIDVSRAWQRTTGDASLLLAVVDTGCDTTNLDLAGRVIAQRDLIEDDDLAEDESGHGTTLATIAAGSAGADGVVGVAPGVSLLCVRVSDGYSAGYDDLAAGIDWAVAQGARVILVGHAGHLPSAALADAVAAAQAADVLVVAPAGSQGGSILEGFPAAYPGVVSVAGANAFDLPYGGTDLGPRTWLFAPAEQVLGSSVAGALQGSDGSSVAAALVAGVAALVRSAEPTLTAAQVRALLRATARPVQALNDVMFTRRIDAGAAVAAASPSLIDLAVEKVSLGAPSLLPGAPVLARVRLENRGVLAAAGATVTITVAGGQVAAPGGTPAPSASAAVDVPLAESLDTTWEVTPDPSAASLTLTARVALPGDQSAANDTIAEAVPIAATVVHRLRIADLDVLPPAPGDTAITVVTTVENAGNVPEAESELRVVHYASPDVDEPAVLAVPPLAPGERAVLSHPVALIEGAEPRFAVGLFVRPAPGQLDLEDASAWVDLLLPSSEPGAVPSYFQLPGDTIIFDAPWRTMRSQIPILVFYAVLDWQPKVIPNPIPLPALQPKPPKPGKTEIITVSLRNPSTPAPATGPIVYQDIVGSPAALEPVAPFSPAFQVTDEDHVGVPNGKVTFSARPSDGAHRVIWFPIADLPNPSSTGMVDPSTRGAFIEATAIYMVRYGGFKAPGVTRKMMAISVDSDPLPRLHENDHYFDAHFHSIAEWYRGPAFNGPAKAFGGPIEMLYATAWALGFIQHPIDLFAIDKVITTDHNTFFDDFDAPRAGPTTPGRWGAAPMTNSPEFEIYRTKLLGRSAAEEVSIKGSLTGPEPLSMEAFLGRHALVYEAKHVNGTWGDPGTLAPLNGCLPDHNELLHRQACRGGYVSSCPGSGSSETCVGGYTFAAHPFAGGFLWNDQILSDSLSLPPYNERRFVSTVDNEFVFRGYQFWNLKPSRRAQEAPRFTLNLRDVNPFAGTIAGFRSWTPNCGNPGTGEAGYRTEVFDGLETFLGHVRRGLRYRLTDDDLAPRARFFRKIFFNAGSDAHGDFNYTLDLLSEVVQDKVFAQVIVFFLGKKHEINDGAYGRPRTYTFGGTMEDMKHGRSVSTDGPVIEVEIDGEGRGWYDQDTGAVFWKDDGGESFDPEGRFGGEGVRDGGRTALVPWVSDLPREADSQLIRMRSRCRNIAAFGGNVTSRFELIMSGRAGTDEPTRRLTLPNLTCDGQWRYDTVPLGATVTDPSAHLSRAIAVVAHAEFGSGCPGTYDAFANPIWLAPVDTRVRMKLVDVGEGKFDLTPREADEDVELVFPISMSPDEVEARVYRIDRVSGRLVALSGGDGGVAGLVPEAGTTGWSDVEEADGEVVATNRLRLRIPEGSPLHGYFQAAVRDDERFVLAVARKSGADRRLRDVFGNPLGIFMVRFRASSCLGFQQMAAGDAASCAVDFDGDVWCWGQNIGGLGPGAPPFSNVAQRVVDPLDPTGFLTDVVEVESRCARKSTGEVFCWGINTQGSLGIPVEPPGYSDVALQISGLPPAIKLAVRRQDYRCALVAGGQVYCWGGPYQEDGEPRQILEQTLEGVPFTDAVDISTDGVSLVALRSDGRLYQWQTQAAQCCFAQPLVVNQAASPDPYLLPDPLVPIDGFALAEIPYSVKTDGTLHRSTVLRVSSIFTAAAVARLDPVFRNAASDPLTGITYADGDCALRDDGTVWCFSVNDRFEEVFTADLPPGEVIDVSGYGTRCLRLGDGTIYCWGNNSVGQLGNGGFAATIAPGECVR